MTRAAASDSQNAAASSGLQTAMDMATTNDDAHHSGPIMHAVYPVDSASVNFASQTIMSEDEEMGSPVEDSEQDGEEDGTQWRQHFPLNVTALQLIVNTDTDRPIVLVNGETPEYALDHTPSNGKHDPIVHDSETDNRLT